MAKNLVTRAASGHLAYLLLTVKICHIQASISLPYVSIVNVVDAAPLCAINMCHTFRKYRYVCNVEHIGLYISLQIGSLLSHPT